MSNRPLDKFYATLILGILTKPFDHQKAYDLQLINSEGKLIKKPVTDDEKDAYTPLHQLVFGVKRIIDLFPAGQTRLKQLATAMNFIRNQHVPEAFKESIDLNQFLKELNLVVENDLCLMEEEALISNYLKEESASPPPTNSTDAIDIHTPVIRRLFVDKKKKEDE